MQGKLILKGIDLSIPAGKKIALVGLSGSGKTTLTNLLPRFYEVPNSWGTIKIDGHDIREYPLSILRQNISMVLQDSILFEGTIRENIERGRPHATNEEIVKAAEKACIHETIIKMPKGYNTKITGKDLSGGQRQRLAIARAILRNAPITIMDEPTAALDAEAEAEVMSAVEGLTEHGTVLMITHRLSTVGKVDEIIVLGEGRVIEQGSFKILLEKDGVFAHLWRAQHPDIDKSEENKTIIATHEASRSFILSNFKSESHHYLRASMLVEVDGQAKGTYQLDKEVLTIGRLAGSDVPVPSEQASRLHAKLLFRNGAWVIEDAQSSNGLRYNAEKFEQRILKDGDCIYLAPRVVLQYKEQPANVVPPSMPLQPKANIIPSLPFQPQVPPLMPVPTPPRKAQVIIEVDREIKGKRELDKQEISIGRYAPNDIIIDSQLISRKQHACILWYNGNWLIKSNEETQKELIFQGQSIHQHVFAAGDRIYLVPSIGSKSVMLRFELLP